MQTYYFVLFVLSALLTGAYMLIWKKHYDEHLTLVFGVIPVTNLGFLLQAQAKTTEAALFATRFAYIGGCFLQLFIMLTIFSLCGIQVGLQVGEHVLVEAAQRVVVVPLAPHGVV